MRPAALLLCGLVLLAAGCERPQQVAHADGHYAGKPDTPAWDGPRFKGDRAQWQRVIKARNLRQNEYERTSGRGT